MTKRTDLQRLVWPTGMHGYKITAAVDWNIPLPGIDMHKTGTSTYHFQDGFISVLFCRWFTGYIFLSQQDENFCRKLKLYNFTQRSALTQSGKANLCLIKKEPPIA
ncbi:hypothetical protein MAR_032684 [Mya arenaria]|uniref:Uncharacterized protein n=1 Tax=Mya arenaria TaxID=6604 RepID=A0ABY7F7J2_MYAAR|nr:hypothetical protein MAR_032684 [Mya arenaria]